MLNVVNARLEQLEPNPYRNLGTYPVLRNKVEALKASIETVGMWPSIIVRRKGKRFEKAFGHSRQIAAKEMGLTEVPVIVMDLTDEQMVQFMGRENGEDYGTDIQIMLNTWEGATTYLEQSRQEWSDVDAARLLGWIELKAGKYDQMTMPARTCASAFKLISGGHMSREDISGIPVSSAYHVVERVISRMELVERNAKAAGTSAPQRASIKKRIVEGGKKTIADVREGKVAAKDIRSAVDVNSLADAKGTKDELPIFRVFGKLLTDSIYRMLRSDVAAEKLQHVVEALPLVSDPEDKALVRRIALDLGDLKVRADKWIGKLEGKRVVELVEGRAS